MKPIQKIVVGTDFSAIADRAVDHAIDLAKQTGASVTLVHAYELPIYSLPDGLVVATPGVAKAITDAGMAGLAKAVEARKDRGVALGHVLRMGPAAEELNGVAAEENADLIVVGTHGRRGFSRFLIGSVAERTVRIATRPVLVVHGAP